MQTSHARSLSLGIVLAVLTHASGAQPTPPSRGARVDLGGFKIFTSEAGSGSPVVVFEAGMGEDIETWGRVQPAIARFTQTFLYDRAGLGKSDPSPQPRSVEQLVRELHRLLRAAHVRPPYILVGHSLGGALVQVYAHEHPEEIAGIVFVDPEDGRLLERLQARMSKAEWEERKKALARVMPPFSPTQTAEFEAVKASGQVLASALPLPKVPVVLLTGTKKDPGFPGNPLEQDIKLELHGELARALPGSRHVLVPQSRHYIQDDAPEVVIQAVHEVWEDARKQR